MVGSSTCLISGGGNEPFACAGPDAICPTFQVSSMPELGQVLRSAAAAEAARSPPPLPPGVAFVEVRQQKTRHPQQGPP